MIADLGGRHVPTDVRSSASRSVHRRGWADARAVHPVRRRTSSPSTRAQRCRVLVAGSTAVVHDASTGNDPRTLRSAVLGWRTLHASGGSDRTPSMPRRATTTRTLRDSAVKLHSGAEFAVPPPGRIRRRHGPLAVPPRWWRQYAGQAGRGGVAARSSVVAPVGVAAEPAGRSSPGTPCAADGVREDRESRPARPVSRRGEASA